MTATQPHHTQSLKPYAALLREWTKKINLVSPDTLETLEERHFKDCAQLLSFLPLEPTTILDVGSGAGLPGLVLAILAPHHTFTLAESDTRKAAFLLTVVQSLGLKNVKVWAKRVEDIPTSETFTIITARAFAPLERLLPQTRPYLAPKGRWLLLKGEAIDAELRACETMFPMTVVRTPSIVPSKQGNHGWVIEITPQLEAA